MGNNLELITLLLGNNYTEYTFLLGNPAIDGKITIEIGGKSKDGKQIAGVRDAYIAADNLEYAVGNKIPLWTFGFLY